MKASPYFRSKSRIKKRGACPNAVASRSCCASQSSLGWRVTLKWTTRREASSTTKRVQIWNERALGTHRTRPTSMLETTRGGRGLRSGQHKTGKKITRTKEPETWRALTVSRIACEAAPGSRSGSLLPGIGKRSTREGNLRFYLENKGE